MINFDVVNVVDLVEKITDKLPLIGGSLKVQYGYGTRESFDLSIALKKYGNKYPIIWLVPSKVTVKQLDNNSGITDLKILIAKQSLQENSPDLSVIKTDFENILYPLLNQFIKALKECGIVNILSDIDYYLEPNYREGEKSKQIDILNVIVLELKAEFRGDKCINDIIWQ